jgi:hypothetical protein
MRSYSASCREARHIIKGLMIKALIIRESNPFTEKSRKIALLPPKPTDPPMELCAMTPCQLIRLPLESDD